MKYKYKIEVKSIEEAICKNCLHCKKVEFEGKPHYACYESNKTGIDHRSAYLAQPLVGENCSCSSGRWYYHGEAGIDMAPLHEIALEAYVNHYKVRKEE